MAVPAAAPAAPILQPGSVKANEPPPSRGRARLRLGKMRRGSRMALRLVRTSALGAVGVVEW